jgi:cytochrome P450
MVTSTTDVYYDPYDVDINANPYPVYRRLREEAPLYYDDVHDFYAASRFEDIEKGFLDARASSRGGAASSSSSRRTSRCLRAS